MEWKKFTIITLLVILVVAFSGLVVLAGKAPTQKGKFLPQKTVVKPNINFKSAVKNSESSGDIKFTIKEITKETTNISMTPSDNKTRIVPPPENAKKVIMNVEAKPINDLPSSIKKDANTTLTLKVKEPVTKTDNPQFTIKPIKSSDEVEWTVEKLPYQTETFDVRYYNSKKDPSIQGLGTMESVVRGIIRDENGNALRDINVAVFDCANFGPGATPLAVTKTIIGGVYRVQFLAGLRVIAFERCQGEWIFVNYKQRVGDICIATPMGDSIEVSGRLPACGAGYPVYGQFFHKDRIDPTNGMPMPWAGAKIGVYDRWGNPIIGNTVPIEAVTNDTGAYMLRIPAMEIPKGIQFGVQRGCTNEEILWVSPPPDNTPGEVGLLPPIGFIVGGKLPECGTDKFVIKGRLSDSLDAPLVGARIFVTDCIGEYIEGAEAFTDSIGEYKLGIPLMFARNVSLHFTPPYPDNTCKYTLSNWDGGTCINLIEEAGLSLGDETNRIEISGKLPSCSNPPIITFSGTLYDSTWTGWAGIRVEAQDCEGNVLNTVFTDQNGSYSLEFPAGLRRIAVYRDDACGMSLYPIFINDPRGNTCINFNKIDRWGGVINNYWVDGVLPGCYDENTLVVSGNIAYIDSIGMPIGDDVIVRVDVWECVAGGLNYLGSDTTEPWGEFWLKVPRPASMRISFTKLCDGSVFWLQPKGMGECIPTGANSWWGIPPQSIWVSGEIPECGKGSTVFSFAGSIYRSTGLPFDNIQVQIWDCFHPANPIILASWTTDEYGYFHGSVDLNDGYGKVQPIQIVFIRNCTDTLFNKPFFLKNKEGGTCFSLPRSNWDGFPKYHYNLNGSIPDCGEEGLTIRGQLWRQDAYWDSLTGMYLQDKTAFYIWQCEMPPNTPPLKTVLTDTMGNFEFTIAPGHWKFAIDRMCKPDSTGFVDEKIFWIKDATGNTCFGLFPHQNEWQAESGEIPFPDPTGEFWFWAELPACRKNTAIVKGQLTVPDPSGSGNIIPLDSTWVFAYPCKNFNEPWNDMLIPTATMTDDNGYYELLDVPAGRPIMIGVDVKGRFGCYPNSNQWVDWFYWLTPEWNPNQLCWILPPEVKEINRVVPNCNAFIRYIISGSVYSDYGFPMDGFGIKLVDLNNPTNIFRMITDAGGNYWFEVPAGTYGVRPEILENIGWNFEPRSNINPLFAYTLSVPMCPPEDPNCDPNFWDGHILVHPPENMKQAYLWIDDGYGTAGSTFDLPVKLDSREANVTASALEFSVYYRPDMLTGKSATATGLAAGATISTVIDSMIPVTLPGGMTVYAGRMKVLIMGTIAPDSGEVALLTFDVSPNAQLCDGSIIWLKESKLIDTSNNGIWVNTRNGFFLITSTTTNFPKGDVNFDGVVNYLDLDYLICYVFGDTTYQGSYTLDECVPEPDKWCVFWVVADMNNDGTIDAVDVQKLKNMIIPPPPPDSVSCTNPDSLIIHNKDLGGFAGQITNIDVFLANCRVLGSIEAKVTYNASQLQLVAMALAPNPAFEGLEFVIPANFGGDGVGDDTVRVLLTDLQGIKKIPSMSENGNRPWKLFQLFFFVKPGKVEIQGISRVGFAFLSSTDGNGNTTPIEGSTEDATSVTFARMDANVLSNGVNISWITTSEKDNIGFNIYRTSDLNLPRVKVNSNIIPAGNGNYSYFDSNVGAGTYYYWIEDVESDGSARRTGPIVVNIDTETLRPTTYRLSQNYPNPFNPTTEISFSIPKGGIVELSIYNVSGQLVRTLVNDYRDIGSYAVKWDGKDNKGKEVSSGLYLYTLKSGEFSATKKMLLMK